MIAKRILTPKGGSGYQRLSGYVLNVTSTHREAMDPASWTRLGAYILDTLRDGEKVAWARVTNCLADDPGWAVKEILATQARNTRSQADKSYHLVVSFPEGERPSREQMEDIEDRLCAAIGFEAHQRVSAVHQNTDNWHLHVAINKVHPTTLRNVTPIRDHYRLQEACAELEIHFGLIREPHTPGPDRKADRSGVRGRAADFEARHGGQSFVGWLRERAAPALLAARDSGKGWPELHRVAAAYDLDIQPRGAGLVIAHRSDPGLRVKASEVDRGLSLPALTARLGAFQPAGQQEAAPIARTRYAPHQRSGAVYDDFRREREAALRARAAAIAALRARHATYGEQLRAYHGDRLRRERLSGLRGSLRRDGFRHLAEQRRRDRAQRIAREAEERRQVRAAHPVPNWQGFLEAQAGLGNEAALHALRTRATRQARATADLLEAAEAGQVRDILHRPLRPAVRRDGRVVYRVADGGLVADEARQVRVSQLTAGATMLALTLAAERFGNRPLTVRGTEEFRQQVAQVAGTIGLSVTFADAALELHRRIGIAGQPKPLDRGRRETDRQYNIRDASEDRGQGR